jgi:50S ribosomal protein L16 3-hydroxylase
MAGSSYRFDEWMSPLSISAFKADYLGRSPFYRREPSEAIRALLRRTEEWSVDALLARHKGDVLAWFHKLDGRHTSVRVSPAAARELYAAGTTLFMGGISEVDAITDEVAAALRLPRSSFFGALFCNKTRAVTRAHFDPVDILCVQLRGTKRWLLADNVDVPAPMQNWATLDPSQPAQRLVTSGPLPVEIPPDAAPWDLERGSFLYVPRGYWHETSSEEESLSLHIGYSSVTYADIVLDALRTHLVRDRTFRESPYSFWEPSAFAENVSHIRGLLERATEAVAALKADDVVPSVASPEPVTAPTCFRRHELASIGVDSWGGADEIADLQVNVHGYPSTRATQLALSRELAEEALRIARLPSGNLISPRALTLNGLAEDEAVQLFSVLENAGLLRRIDD